MALPSWPNLTQMAGKASRKKGIKEVSKGFYKSLHIALKKEEKKKRNSGDKQGLANCLKSAMETLIEHLIDHDKNIERVKKYKIEVPDLPRGKFPDYALQKGNRIYLIEQKSILRFNEFSQVFFEALIARKYSGLKKIRFAGLFNYLHQEKKAFEKLCVFERKRIVHHLCILIPDIEYTEYSIDEVDNLFLDIKTFFK
jgi:hypothetical protein